MPSREEYETAIFAAFCENETAEEFFEAAALIEGPKEDESCPKS